MATIILTQHKNDIGLQTRKRNDIPNAQSEEISAFEASQELRVTEKYKQVEYRTESIPIYNCHGMTFASRRTGIYDVEAISKILQDDNYQEIVSEHVLPGDVVLYYSLDGDVEHSGIVVIPPSKFSLRIPKVLSKWGKFREVIHWGNECPYDFSNHKYFRVIR